MFAWHDPASAQEKTVYGWVTFSDTKWPSPYTGGNIPADSLPWDALTHVGLFAANGNTPPQSYYVNQYGAFTARAHKSGVYAGITVGGSGDAALVTMIADPSSWNNWIRTYLGYLDQHKMDFIDFDFEGSYSASNIGGFFTVLYDSLQKRWCGNNPAKRPFIVLTASVSHAISWNSQTIRDRVEFVNLMTYDYNNSAWGRVTFDNAPKSYRWYNGTGGATDSMGTGTNAIAPSMQRMAIRVSAAGWPKAKLTVGLDVNGGAWGNATQIRQSTSGTIGGGSDATFAQIWPTISQMPRESIYFDQVAQAYWFTTGGDLWTFLTLPGRDSGMIATRKVVDSMGIGGVCIWNLGNEGWNASPTPPGGRGWFFSQIRQHLNFDGSNPPPPPPPPPGPVDTIAPTVAFVRPATGDSLTGIVAVEASASDNIGVNRVQFLLDGSNIGNADYTVPYTFSWNTDPYLDGNHTLSAVAYDNAGRTGRRDISVRLYTPVSPPPPDTIPVGSADSIVIYGDALTPPFVNGSWGTTITWQSAERKLTGAAAMKAVQNGWGGISVHSGSWAAPVPVTAGPDDELRLSVFPESQANLRVELENDLGDGFGYAILSNVPPGRWSTYTLRVGDLNPDNRPIHLVNVQNWTSSPVTYHLDEFKFLIDGVDVPPGGGGGGGSVLSYDRTSIDFGNVLIGREKTDSVYIVNGTDAPVVVTGVQSTSSRFTARSVLSTIAPRSSGKVYVTFRPDYRSTFASYLLTFAANGVTIDTVGLRGTGVRRSWDWSTTAVNITPTPSQSTAVDSFSVTNDGDIPLVLNAATTRTGISVSPAEATVWPNESLTFSVKATTDGRRAYTGHVIVTPDEGAADSVAVDVRSISGAVPSEYEISQNYPNPFNPTTTIDYALPEGGPVRIALFNLLGQEVMVLVDGVQEAGYRSVEVDASTLPSGVYFYRIAAGTFTGMKKMLLVR